MIKVDQVYKSFGQNQVLKGIDLSVNEGEIITIIGPSGSGKSTLLRSINMLEKADAGHLSIDDLNVDLGAPSKKDQVKVRQKAAMVFQNYNLFKNKTALENITEGLIVSLKMSKKEAEVRGRDLLKKVGLENFENAMPSQLSGGQQQRVGIARAMALKPKVILFDEPTSALDPELVGEVLQVIKDLAKENITMIIVTHEMDFAKEVSDRIIFMDEGLVSFEGTPSEVFSNKMNMRLKSFLGKVA